MFEQNENYELFQFLRLFEEQEKNYSEMNEDDVQDTKIRMKELKKEIEKRELSIESGKAALIDLETNFNENNYL